MTVYLIRTPDMPEHELMDVYDVLHASHGPVNFRLGDIAADGPVCMGLKNDPDENRFDVPDKNLKMVPTGKNSTLLSWGKLFGICERYREEKNIVKEDFVILLTKRRNALNFFSSYEEHSRNCFIQASDWELFTHTDMKYPVSYQVFANILMVLMQITLASSSLKEYMHMVSIGCMNDFCRNKREIVLKLRTADICDKCLNTLKKKNVPNDVIFQALHFFDSIRKQTLYSQGFTRNVMAYPVLVTGNTIIINGSELRLSPLARTLWLFFLKHPEGVRVVELSDHRPELESIYLSIRRGGDLESIRNMTLMHNGSFDYNKSKLNALIRRQLGDNMAGFYMLEGTPGEKFGIRLDPSLVSYT